MLRKKSFGFFFLRWDTSLTQSVLLKHLVAFLETSSSWQIHLYALHLLAESREVFLGGFIPLSLFLQFRDKVHSATFTHPSGRCLRPCITTLASCLPKRSIFPDFITFLNLLMGWVISRVHLQDRRGLLKVEGRGTSAVTLLTGLVVTAIVAVFLSTATDFLSLHYRGRWLSSASVVSLLQMNPEDVWTGHGPFVYFQL